MLQNWTVEPSINPTTLRLKLAPLDANNPPPVLAPFAISTPNPRPADRALPTTTTSAVRLRCRGLLNDQEWKYCSWMLRKATLAGWRPIDVAAWFRAKGSSIGARTNRFFENNMKLCVSDPERFQDGEPPPELNPGKDFTYREAPRLSKSSHAQLRALYRANPALSAREFCALALTHFEGEFTHEQLWHWIHGDFRLLPTANERLAMSNPLHRGVMQSNRTEAEYLAQRRLLHDILVTLAPQKVNLQNAIAALDPQTVDTLKLTQGKLSYHLAMYRREPAAYDCPVSSADQQDGAAGLPSLPRSSLASSSASTRPSQSMRPLSPSGGTLRSEPAPESPFDYESSSLSSRSASPWLPQQYSPISSVPPSPAASEDLDTAIDTGTDISIVRFNRADSDMESVQWSPGHRFPYDEPGTPDDTFF